MTFISGSFLFNIKRSEVKGPILQFQSTIFQKEDIKKLVKTLNKAYGEAAIPDARLDKSFEVWYPTLEEDLNKINSEAKKVDEVQEADSDTYTPEILEKILELSRDNQRLLRTTDAGIADPMFREKAILKRNMLMHDIPYMLMNYLDEFEMIYSLR